MGTVKIPKNSPEMKINKLHILVLYVVSLCISEAINFGITY